MSLEQQLAELRALAAGLCHDCSVEVVLVPDGWSWSRSQRTISVSQRDLAQLGPSGCAALVAHEVGHGLVSRYSMFSDSRIESPVVRRVLNALEDPRVEHFVALRFAGVREWLRQRAALESEAWASEPPGVTLQVIQAFHSDGMALAVLAPSQADSPSRHELARKIVSATREARRRHITETLPHPSLLQAPYDAVALHRAEVAPYLDERERAPATRLEAWIQVLARRAFLICRDEIMPHLVEAIDADVAAVGRFLVHGGGIQHDVRQVVDAGDIAQADGLLEAAHRLPVDENNPTGAARLALARRVVDQLLNHACRVEPERYRPIELPTRAAAPGAAPQRSVSASPDERQLRLSIDDSYIATW
jgi:hypothetical protein